MGRIVTNVKIKNLFDPDSIMSCDALVDRDTAFITLPSAWNSRFGKLSKIREIDCEIATQLLIKAEVYGPVEIQIEGFKPIYSEVAFIEMEPVNGVYEPLIGYIVLEQSQAAVDILGH